MRYADLRLRAVLACAVLLATALLGVPPPLCPPRIVPAIGGTPAWAAVPWAITAHIANRALRGVRHLAGRRIAVRAGSGELLHRLARIPGALLVHTAHAAGRYRVVARSRADAAVDTFATAGDMVLRACRPLLKLVGPLSGGLAPPHPRRSGTARWIWKALDQVVAMISPALIMAPHTRWSTADAEPERRYRGWVLGCWFSVLVWGVALSACVVGLRRHARRLTRTARLLHRRLGTVRAAARAAASARDDAPSEVHGSMPDANWAGERLGMVATLCHEIRTPMHAVIGILELLMHKTAIRGEARYYIGTAHECAKSLITLVGDVLDMAKLEAGRLEIRPEPVQLATLLRQLVHAFRPLAVSQRLRIRLRMGLLRGRRHRVDPQRLRQIVGNLLSNAIKYSHHGEIVVKLESAGDGAHGETIRIVVQDHGPGIDAQQMPRLFEPFFRADGDGGTCGTGLGLSISRQLARQMGGELEIVSKPGAGTTAIVTLVLPSAAGAGRAARGDARLTAPRRMPTPPLRKGYCALVVDDHPAGRMLLARQLGHLGVDAVCAGDGTEALALCAAREGGFDVMITDCNMPGMDGFSLTRRLRAQERALARRRIPVLGYSADARQQNLERALAAGMDDCLFKPIDLDSLARVLHRWLRDTPPSRPPRTAVPPAPTVLPLGGGSSASPPLPMPPPPMDTDAAIREALLAGNAADLAALRTAFEARDWHAMRAIAHRIKGATRLASAHDAASCCEAVEAACHVREAEAASNAIEALAQRLDELANRDFGF